MIARQPTKKALRKAEKRRRRAALNSAPPAVATNGHKHPVTALPRRRAHTTAQVWARSSLYVVALTLAEIVTVLVDTRWGIIGHAIVLALLIAEAAVNAYSSGGPPDVDSWSLERQYASFLTALALVPLIRIVSLAMPLAEFPELSWYGIIALPLLAAAWSAARACGYGRRELGLSLAWRPIPVVITIIVSLSGIGIGYLEYLILRPDPLIDVLTPLHAMAASAILLVGTGLTEEVIFRGVLQRAGIVLFGVVPGIAYSAVCFAILHIGHRSLLDVGFVFVVAILFGLIVLQTRTLVGVTVAHGLTNICLFILFPHLLGNPGSP